MRRLLALVNGLGPHARARDEETGGWGPLEHLVATVADRIEDNRHTTVAASPLTFHPFEPRRVPRPSVAPKAPVSLTPGEFFKRMGEVSDG